MYFDKHGFRYEQLGPLMAHGGTVIDQVIGTADEDNPDDQMMSIRFVKVPTAPTAVDLASTDSHRGRRAPIYSTRTSRLGRLLRLAARGYPDASGLGLGAAVGVQHDA